MKTEKIHKTPSQTKLKRRQKILFIGNKSALVISDTHSTADKMKQPLLPPPSKLIKLKLVALVKPMKHKCSAQENTGKFRGVEQRLPSTREAWDSIQNTGNASGRQGNKQIYIPSLENTRERNASTLEIIAFLSTADKNSPKINLQKLGLVAGTHPQSQHSGG